MTTEQERPGGLAKEDCELLEELLEETRHVKRYLHELAERVDNLGKQIEKVLGR